MKILNYPDKALQTKCEPVTVFGEELKTILDGMWDTMKENKGVGLAANQVGILRNMFVMAVGDTRVNLVNPQIVWSSETPAMLREGCLSAPGEFLVVFDRADSVIVEFQNHHGDSLRRRFEGLHAVCVQHEIEHLQGLNFMESKSLSNKTKKHLAKKWGMK